MKSQYDPYQPPEVFEIPAEPTIPEKFRPLGPWAYFGYNILFAIPVVGLIFAIVFACGGTNNINLRNYARSFFCALLVSVILGIVFFVISLIAGVSFAELAGNI